MSRRAEATSIVLAYQVLSYCHNYRSTNAKGHVTCPFPELSSRLRTPDPSWHARLRHRRAKQKSGRHLRELILLLSWKPPSQAPSSQASRPGLSVGPARERNNAANKFPCLKVARSFWDPGFFPMLDKEGCVESRRPVAYHLSTVRLPTGSTELISWATCDQLQKNASLEGTA